MIPKKTTKYEGGILSKGYFQLPYSEKIWRGFNLAQGKNEIFGATREFLISL